MFADLIDGPLAHMPSGHFGANSAWVLCAAIAHNLLHTAGILASGPDVAGPHARARGATLRRQLISVPARLARPARAPVLHLPSRWPWAPAWLRLWNHLIGHRPTSRCLTPTPPTHRPEYPILGRAGQTSDSSMQVSAARSWHGWRASLTCSPCHRSQAAISRPWARAPGRRARFRGLSDELLPTPANAARSDSGSRGAAE